MPLARNQSPKGSFAEFRPHLLGRDPASCGEVARLSSLTLAGQIRPPNVAIAALFGSPTQPCTGVLGSFTGMTASITGMNRFIAARCGP